MDIVKRLRGDYGVPVPFITTPICHEAADEIERLRQQVAELVDALEKVMVWIFDDQKIKLKNEEDMQMFAKANWVLVGARVARGKFATGGE